MTELKLIALEICFVLSRATGKYPEWRLVNGPLILYADLTL
jgi:hypothetical protein